MHITKFTLKQHTPIIHFQADDTGATLRASEVKPKLDRFLVSKIGAETIRKQHKNWIRRDEDEKIALDYALSFVAINYQKIPIENKHKNSPMYFGNMGENDTENKHFVFSDSVIGKIKCKYKLEEDKKEDNKKNKKELLDYIEEYLPEFFFLHNFGTRQSKGYGSFTVESINNKPVKFNFSSQYSFTLDVDNWGKAMTQLDVFYKSLRSGINIGKPTSYDAENNSKSNIKTNTLEIMDTRFYMKPVIFVYAKHKYKSQWDKKSIKQTFFNTDYSYYKGKNKKFIQTLGLKGQIDSFEKTPDVLGFSSSGKHLDFRDLFGLSTVENWRSYGATIEKSIKNIDRYKSPITFKVLEQQRRYKVFIIINPLDNRYLESSLIVNSIIGQLKNKKHLTLEMPIDFSFEAFFNFITTEFSLEDSIKTHYRNYKNRSVGNLYQILKNIYEQLKNNQ